MEMGGGDNEIYDPLPEPYMYKLFVVFRNVFAILAAPLVVFIGIILVSDFVEIIRMLLSGRHSEIVSSEILFYLVAIPSFLFAWVIRRVGKFILGAYGLTKPRKSLEKP